MGGNAAVAARKAAAQGKSAARYKRRFEKRRKLEKLSRASRSHTGENRARPARDFKKDHRGLSMRPGQNKRLRGRNNNNGRKGPNPLTRSFESNGPDVKIRGTAQHVAEKYLQLARDAQTSGDIVMAENLLQHAEHYFRLIAAAQQQSTNAYGRQSFEAENDIEDDDDDFTGIPDRFAPLAERLPPAPPAFAAPAGLFGSAAASAAAFRAAAAVRRTAFHRATTPRTSESPGAAAVPRTSRPQPGSRRIGPRPGSCARPQCRARRRDRRARSSHGVRAQPRSQ